MKNYMLLLFIFFGLIACTPTVAELEATAVPVTSTISIKTETAVATHTPATIDNTPTPTPTDTPLPAPTLMPTESSSTKTPRATPTIEVSHEISQTYTTSANGVQFVMDTRIAAAVYPELSRETVQYRRSRFAPEGFCRDVGCVTVYDVASFRAEIPGGNFIMDDLVTALANSSETHIPTWGAAILLQVQEKALPVASGQGIRAVVMRGQNAFWAHNEAIVYDFHGLTADGRYYINVTIPIDAPILIDNFDPADNTNPNALPIPEIAADPAEEVVQMVQYNTEAAQRLDDLPEAAFAPDLALLDALVASLTVGDE